MYVHIITLFVAAALVLMPSSTFAQQTPVGSPPTISEPPSQVPTVGQAPPVGSPLLPGTSTGLDKVGDDGVSTKTVRAVGCGTAARETDGTTTCVGIPEDGTIAKKNRR
jgi:hypothetical protein